MNMRLARLLWTGAIVSSLTALVCWILYAADLSIVSSAGAQWVFLGALVSTAALLGCFALMTLWEREPEDGDDDLA